MKVRCNLCLFEKNGFCQKKRQSGKPVRVEVNKARTCDKYDEDAIRVLASYRKKEAHKANLQRQELKRIRMNQVLQQMKEHGIKEFTDLSENK